MDGKSRKGRLDDKRVGFAVEGRMEDDGMGWDGMGDGDVVKEKQGVEYRECWLMDDLIQCRKQTNSY